MGILFGSLNLKIESSTKLEQEGIKPLSLKSINKSQNHNKMGSNIARKKS